TTAGTNGKVLREIPCPPPFCALRYKHIRAIRHSLADLFKRLDLTDKQRARSLYLFCVWPDFTEREHERPSTRSMRTTVISTRSKSGRGTARRSIASSMPAITSGERRKSSPWL